MVDCFGLDFVEVVLERMFCEFGEFKYCFFIVLKKMVCVGYFGVKMGEGFFKYDKDGDWL